jgi:cytochrome P450
LVPCSRCAAIDSAHSVAGSDTSATGIRATMLGIISNPRVYAKLTAEIDAAMASGKIPTHSNAVISDAQAKELPYLQACIKEVTALISCVGDTI